MMKKAFVAFLFSLVMLSCGKEDTDRLPDVYINYSITLQEFDLKKNQDDILLVNGQGIAGLIICKVAGNQYKAFDRCSTVNPEKKCAVVPENSFTATDPCSGAKFLLLDGSPAKSPATKALKQYQVTLTNYQIIVTNTYGN